ncbi:hypothetical protein LY76DRAFT_359688 [Colletotrichum caudatum]|nr:hypothetical protein LY76DRAFT_359688 [Colletotrichum caudatum]
MGKSSRQRLPSKPVRTPPLPLEHIPSPSRCSSPTAAYLQANNLTPLPGGDGDGDGELGLTGNQKPLPVIKQLTHKLGLTDGKGQGGLGARGGEGSKMVSHRKRKPFCPRRPRRPHVSRRVPLPVPGRAFPSPRSFLRASPFFPRFQYTTHKNFKNKIKNKTR